MTTQSLLWFHRGVALYLYLLSLGWTQLCILWSLNVLLQTSYLLVWGYNIVLCLPRIGGRTATKLEKPNLRPSHVWFLQEFYRKLINRKEYFLIVFNTPESIRNLWIFQLSTLQAKLRIMPMYRSLILSLSSISLTARICFGFSKSILVLFKQ